MANAVYEVKTDDGKVYEIELPSEPTQQPSPVQTLARTAASSSLTPMVSQAQSILGTPNRLAKSVMRVPQSVLDMALPTLGGITGSIPGMAAGGVAAKALSMARTDPGRPITGQQVLPTVAELAKAGVITGAMGKVGHAVSGGIHALRVMRNVPLRAGFLRSVRQAFLHSKKLAGESFGVRLDALAAAHPKQTIDLSVELAQVQQQTLNNPAFKAMLSRAALNSKESTLVQNLINQPEAARTLTMQEAQSLKSVVGRMLKQKFQQISPELTDAHLDANDFYHGIRLAQLKAFPEFADIAETYHTTLTNFRTIKPYLTQAALEPAILSRFGNRAEIQEAVRELLPKETVSEITRLVKAHLFPQRVRRTAGLGVAALTVGEILRRTGK